jgi:hypothetical protein
MSLPDTAPDISSAGAQRVRAVPGDQLGRIGMKVRRLLLRPSSPSSAPWHTAWRERRRVEQRGRR